MPPRTRAFVHTHLVEPREPVKYWSLLGLNLAPDVYSLARHSDRQLIFVPREYQVVMALPLHMSVYNGHYTSSNSVTNL